MDLPGLVDTRTLEANSLGKESTMPRSKSPYPRQFGEEVVRLVPGIAPAILG